MYTSAKKPVTEADAAWHFPYQVQEPPWCAVCATTTSPRGRQLVLQRFFKWLPEMDPGFPGRPSRSRADDCQRSRAYRSVYCHALREVLRRRDGGLAYFGCELTIYAPRMAPIKVLLEQRDLARCLVSEDTGLILATEE